MIKAVRWQELRELGEGDSVVIHPDEGETVQSLASGAKQSLQRHLRKAREKKYVISQYEDAIRVWRVSDAIQWDDIGGNARGVRHMVMKGKVDD